ncbi:hypothetical protein [Demequina maris]|uniref:hypothetical protein n=1 Tax=Demequina maris TaxID=1638982 RepID=UPI0007865F6C|nr:hypothetical protein [Demequina maris]
MELWLADSAWTAAVMAAAIEAGTAERDADRVLVTASCAEVPEVAHWWTDEPPAFIAPRFRAVVDLNRVIEPFHPTHYAPPPRNRHDIVAAIFEACGAHDITSIVVPSLDTRPSTTLLDVFPTSPVTLVTAELAQWAAASPSVAPARASRVTARAHVDLIDGSAPRPRGLSVESVEISADAVAAVVRESTPLGQTPAGIVIADADPFAEDAIPALVRHARQLGDGRVAVVLAHARHDSRYGDVALELARHGVHADVVGWGPTALAWAAAPGTRAVGRGSTALLAARLLGSRCTVAQGAATDPQNLDPAHARALADALQVTSPRPSSAHDRARLWSDARRALRRLLRSLRG